MRHQPQLQLVTTGKQTLSELEHTIKQLNAKQIDILQIREKHLTAKDIITWVQSLKALLPYTKIIVNDRLDAAIAAGADGVQLAYHSLSPLEARQLLDRSCLQDERSMTIGCSVHSIEEAQQAECQGADYVIFGHVYGTASKPGLEPRGIDALKAVVTATRLPVFAIGGIQPEHIGAVLDAGSSGIALLSGVLLHPHPADALQAYTHTMDRYSLGGTHS